jgi:phosphatidylglycerol:prolipoprotein diacylglycerol transferase
MHRIILDLGFISITSWGVMLAIAFIIGIWLSDRRAVKYNVPRLIIGDLTFVIIISSVIGGRLAYIIENFSYYLERPGEMLKVWEGGMILYGGIGLAVLCGMMFLKYKKTNILPVMDIMAPALALGIGIGRLGCFLNGCCFGKPTNSPCGMTFPADSPAGWTFTSPTAVHPTQIYESIFGFCLFGLLLLIEKRLFKAKKQGYGYLFWILLLIYSIWRFFIDFVRYFESNAYIIAKLTHGQVVSICILVGSIIAILITSRKNKKEER